jgi:uncharacterized membrane protein
MSDTSLLLKWLHVVSATVLLGTGAGIAFFLMRAHRTGDARIIASVARDVVLADFAFTATAVVVQPVTGMLLMRLAGLQMSQPWLHCSMVLFVAIGCCWLPVVWLQLRMGNLARVAAARGAPLPAQYHRCYRLWLALGWPAFLGVLAIFWLMVSKRGS